MPSSVEIGPVVPEMKSFKVFFFFFIIYGHGGNLGHVTCIIYYHRRFQMRSLWTMDDDGRRTNTTISMKLVVGSLSTQKDYEF